MLPCGTLRLVQLGTPGTADYVLGTEYDITQGPGFGLATFLIPGVAPQGGILLLLNPNNPPAEVTLTGIYSSPDHKLLCFGVTNVSYDCSANPVFTNELDGASSMSGSGLVDWADSKILLAQSDDPPPTFSPTNINLNDPPADPASIPEPGKLPLLLAGL